MMFVGSVPRPVVSQLLRLLEPHRGEPVYVCCSGSFRVDLAIKAAWPEARVFSNDVSLFSCALGGLLTGGADEIGMSFIEDLASFDSLLTGAAPLRRLAVLVVVLEACRYTQRNAFGRRMRAYYESHRDELVGDAEAKLKERFADRSVDGFFAGDFRVHAERAGAEGGIVIAFPPTYKGGYERLYRRLEQGVSWERPSYALWDPKEIEAWIAALRKASTPHCVFVDHEIAGLMPLAKYIQPRQRPILLYGTLAGSTSLRQRTLKSVPFAYKPVDPAALHAGSRLEIARIEAGPFNFLRNRYLAKGIDFTDGMYHYLVRVDGAVAGGFSLARSKFGSLDAIYLLSDFAIRRERRLAKLIAMLATGQDMAREVERHLLLRLRWVDTTIFTERACSMKYRGIFQLVGRKPGFLNYRSAIREQSAQAIYQEWFQRYAFSDQNHTPAAG